MKPPKILPWIARKAGLSDELTLKLWRRAAGESENLCGDCDSAEYHAATVDRFLALVEAESDALAGDADHTAQPCWMGRYQNDLLQLDRLVAYNLSRTWQANWRKLIAISKSPTAAGSGRS